MSTNLWRLAIIIFSGKLLAKFGYLVSIEYTYIDPSGRGSQKCPKTHKSRCDDKIKIHLRSSKYLRNKFAFNCICEKRASRHKRPRHAKMPQNIGQNQIKLESDERGMTTIKYSSNVCKMYGLKLRDKQFQRLVC